jgi:hypothetical protein
MLISTSELSRSRIGVALVGISVILAATACGTGVMEAPSTASQSPGSQATAPDGPLVQQLTREVSDARALEHLQALQKIADEHGGNRASGTPGYDASVEYVVGVLRNARLRSAPRRTRCRHRSSTTSRPGPAAT